MKGTPVQARAESKTKEIAKWQEIDPDLAQFYLDFNAEHQRPLNLQHVDYLTKEMREGRWRVNGDTIRIDRDGRLIDGQHRLRAIVKSGVTIRMLVVENLEPEAFVTIDMGAKSRSHSDIFAMKGETCTAALSTTLTAIYRYKKRDFPATALKPSTQELLELLEEEPAARESSRLAFATRAKYLRSGAGALLCHFPRLTDYETWVAFWDSLQKGVNLEEGSPVYRLRERLIKNGLQSAKLRQTDTIAITIKAWNYTLTKRNVKALVWRGGDEPFPQFL